MFIGPLAETLRRSLEPKLASFRQGIDIDAPIRVMRAGAGQPS
jgi:hypothetical protein